MAFVETSEYYFYSALRNENVFLFDPNLIMSSWLENNTMRIVYMDGQMEFIDVPFTVRMDVEEPIIENQIEEQPLPPVPEEDPEDETDNEEEEEEEENENAMVVPNEEEEEENEEEEQEEEEEEEQEEELIPPVPVPMIREYLEILGP